MCQKLQFLWRPLEDSSKCPSLFIDSDVKMFNFNKETNMFTVWYKYGYFPVNDNFTVGEVF